MPKETLSIRAEESLIRELEALAEMTGETRSELAERALRLGVEQVRELTGLLSKPVIGTTLGRLLQSPEFLRSLGEGIEEAEAKARRAGNIMRNIRRKEEKS